MRTKSKRLPCTIERAGTIWYCTSSIYEPLNTHGALSSCYSLSEMSEGCQIYAISRKNSSRSKESCKLAIPTPTVVVEPLSWTLTSEWVKDDWNSCYFLIWLPKPKRIITDFRTDIWNVTLLISVAVDNLFSHTYPRLDSVKDGHRWLQDNGRCLSHVRYQHHSVQNVDRHLCSLLYLLHLVANLHHLIAKVNGLVQRAVHFPDACFQGRGLSSNSG